MRKLVISLLFLILPATLFAQSPGEEGWRRGAVPPANTPSPHALEITPSIAYRWGGTIYGDQTYVFNQDLDVAPSAAAGITVGFPIGNSGMKLELLANRQQSELESNGGLFEPGIQVADMDVTYIHAGIQIPFGASRNAIPYGVASAGVAILDPRISGLSSENRFSGSLGIGVKLPLSRNFGVRLEGRGYFVAMDNNSDDCFVCGQYDDDYYYYDDTFYQGEVSAGFTFSF